MKPWLIAVVCSPSFIATLAMAQTCPGSSRLPASVIQSSVAGNYVCVGNYPNADWNELHSGSNVIDYKKGPNDPVDPSSTVGTFAVTSSGTDGVITYNYNGGGGTYSYYVQPAGGSQYYFCPSTGAAPVITVTIQPSHC